jgi:serine/threonine-protein kinase
VESQFQPVPRAERRFGRYTLLYRIASGGMASLYLGHYAGPDGFEKFVAIKRIHSHLAENREFCRMFIDEARLAARISHPNVAHVLELGAVAGSYFIAMEYVDGESLNAILRRARLPLETAVSIVSHAAMGLHSAHELRGIDGNLLQVVHRDVSPSNLLVTYDGVVKVVDFGVAKAKGNTAVTGVHTVKGKFAYIAPEQLAGESAAIDRRADIFALGIVLHEATTWRRLFYAETDAATAELVLSKEIPTPSSIDPDYPPALEAIVMRALARERERRFQTAHELHLELESYLAAARTPVLQSTIGDLMSRTFPDAIAEKTELMRSCRRMLEGLPPPQEHDSLTPVASDGDPQSVVVPRRRIWIGVAAAVALGTAGAALAVAWNRNGPAPVSERRDERGEPVRVEVRTSPADAVIELDGKPTMNPLVLRQARGARPLRVHISAPGFASRELELAFGESRSWVVALDRALAPATREAIAAHPAPEKPEPLPKRIKGKGLARKAKPEPKKDSPVVKDLFKNPYDKK